MTARRTITAKWARTVLIAQAAECGRPIPCILCKEPILPDQVVMLEHLHDLGTGGKDEPENTRYAHLECALRKTNGTKATTAGSDKNRQAKVKRLRGETKQGPKRKIKSRGFAPGKRRLRG